MRGHEPLLTMRRNGRRPSHVTLTDCPPPKPLSDGTRMDWWALSDVSGADVSIDPEDNPALVDLRFVVGMLVFVDIDDPQRMRKFVAACQSAGAERVFGSSHRIDRFASGDLRVETIDFVAPEGWG